MRQESSHHVQVQLRNFAVLQHGPRLLGVITLCVICASHGLIRCFVYGRSASCMLLLSSVLFGGCHTIYSLLQGILSTVNNACAAS
jgi:hypothetical protein